MAIVAPARPLPSKEQDKRMEAKKCVRSVFYLSLIFSV